MAVQPVVDGAGLDRTGGCCSSLQDRIEPLLEQLAGGYDTVRVRRGVLLEDLQGDARRGARSLGGPTGTERIDARWVVAADGAASAVRRAIGVRLDGPTELATLVNCQFVADLDRWTASRPAALYWTTAPARNVFQKIDTAHRWLCQIGYDPRVDPADSFTADKAQRTGIRRSVGVGRSRCPGARRDPVGDGGHGGRAAPLAGRSSWWATPPTSCRPPAASG
ncbi:MAG: FAD-dependent monooxygenase [Acidimicrobiales bacterium]